MHPALPALKKFIAFGAMILLTGVILLVVDDPLTTNSDSIAVIGLLCIGGLWSLRDEYVGEAA